MTTYTCKACGAPATVADGKVLRTCGCMSAITAHIKAHATGVSQVAGDKK